jgi:hypothetical protein
MSLCKYFNLPTGCNRDAAKCGHRHELYCTNPLCEGAAAKTHTLETCGRIGGGGHKDWIKRKREEAMAAKAAAKAAACEAKQEAAMLSDLYEAMAAIVGELLAIAAEGRDEGKEEDDLDEEKAEEEFETDANFVPTGWVPEEEQPNNQAAE